MEARFPAAALIKRELITSFRRWPALICLVLVVAAMSLVMVALWPEEGLAFGSASATALETLRIITTMLFVAAVLLVPALAAGAVVIERDQDTLDLLLLSLIRPSGIVAAKVLNTFGLFIVLILAAQPVLAAAFMLVGVDWRQIGQSLLLTVATTVAVTCAGVLASALVRNAFAAIAASYLAVAALMLGFIPMALITALFLWVFPGFGSFRGAFDALFALGCPARAFYGVIDGTLPMRWFLLSLVYQGVFAGVCFLLARRAMLRPLAPPRVELEKPIDDPLLLTARRKSFPYYLIDPLKRKPMIEDGRNPMYVKEMRWGLMSRATLLVRIFYCGFVVYFATGILFVYIRTNVESIATWIMIQMGLTILVCPALVSNAFTKEHEQGNLDMLRMTLLSPRQILLGKFASSAATLSPLAVASIVAALPLLIMTFESWPVLISGYITLAVCFFLSLCIGTAVSLRARRTRTALALGYGFAFMVFIGFALLAYLGLELSGMPLDDLYETNAPIVDAAMFVSPLTAYMHNLLEVSGAMRDNTAGRIFNLRASYVLFTPYWFVNTLAFAGFGLGLLGLSLRHFARRRMQDV